MTASSLPDHPPLINNDFITPHFIENLPIQAEAQDSLTDHIVSCNIGDQLQKFINGHHRTIYFEEYIGTLLLTGNELLYYPTLAKKLQTLEEYPRLKRYYPFNTQKLEGIPLLVYFADHIGEYLRQFQADLSQASRVVSDLIQQYGQTRHMPIIDGVDSSKSQRLLIIHGIPWRLVEDYNRLRITESINLCDLLGLRDRIDRNQREFEPVTLENALLGTPFIEVRVRKNWNCKGRVMWYDLNTKQLVSKAERTKWQPPLQGKTQ